MNKEKIASLIQQYEGPKLEHKSKEYFSSRSSEIAKDISSFINTDGGLIIVGVRDRKPDGLIFQQKDEEKIMNICRDLLAPSQTVNFNVYDYDSSKIVIIEMVPSREPVQANEKYYKRQGSTIRAMTHDEVKRKFAEARKIYKMIPKKDAIKIIRQRQNYSGILIDEEHNNRQYLTLGSASGPILGSKNNIYTTLYESFDEKSKIVFSTLHGVTIDELEKIVAQYYLLFGEFSYSTAAFSIEQSGFNWVGFGPQNFISTIEKQAERYQIIRKIWGNDVHIHHRESAFFIDEIKNGIFFISCEPNYMIGSKPTIDYFDVGFVLTEQPFSRLFNDFFHNIDIEPFIIFSNEESSRDRPSVITQRVIPENPIPFQAVGLIQSNRPRNKDKHIWISGAYGNVPKQLHKLELNSRVVAQLHQHHWLEDKVTYQIERINYTKFDLHCFPAAIVSIDIDWAYKD